MSQHFLTKEQYQLLYGWLDKKGIKRQCPQCNHETTEFQGTFAMAPSCDNEGWENKNFAYVFALLSCSNCSHTRFFDVTMIGLLPADGASAAEGKG